MKNMLKPKYIDQLPEHMIVLYSQAEMDILSDMARRISTYDYFIPAAQWQYKKLIEMGNFHSFITEALSTRTGKTKQEIKRLMEEAGQEALRFDDEIYQKVGLDPPPLAESKALQEVLKVGMVNTLGLFSNLTKTTANTATKQFEDALDRAFMQISTGAFDYNSAIRRAVKDLSEKGVASIKYPSGHTDYMEVAVRRAVVTGVNQTAAKMQEARADEMGCDLVETTAHAGARPSHVVWQGKVFSRSGDSDKYPNFEESTGYGTGAGLGGWNCRHNFFPFFEGISSPAYSEEQLKEYDAKKYTCNGDRMTEYEAVSKQRYIERQIRRWKRENLAMKESGFDTAESASKIANWQSKEKDFLKQTGLKSQNDRSQIGKFGKSEARKASAEAEKYYRHWINGITHKGAPNKLADYYEMKYNKPKEYRLLEGYANAVEKGDISPLVGFDVYKSTAAQIEKELVGLITVNGIAVKDYVTHFVDRVIGQTVEPHNGKRMGVPISKAKDTLTSGVPEPIRKNKGKSSQRYIGNGCIVTMNPETGMLIQLNPGE